ncbi:MAG: sugar ABC transporter permease [Chloroflexi bacterium]|nr:MAG: sugar ABC transporter permease [Chloroflexota bacterium]
MTTVQESAALSASSAEAATAKLNPRRLLVGPALIYLIILTQVPLLFTIYYSTLRWRLDRPNLGRPFVGIDNFTRIATDRNIPEILLNTVVLTVSVVVISLIVGMVLALLLNRHFAGRNIVRTLLITPFLVMPAVTAVMWKNVFFNASIGLFSSTLHWLGLGRVDWLGQFPMESLIAIISWQWTPFMMLILLAGLQSLGHDLIEAAQIDGAGPFKIFRYIILPHLYRYIEIGVLMETLFILSVFGEIFIVTLGGPGNQTTNLSYAVFKTAFESFRIGRASALGLFAVVIANIFVLLFIRVLRHQPQEAT